MGGGATTLTFNATSIQNAVILVSSSWFSELSSSLSSVSPWMNTFLTLVQAQDTDTDNTPRDRSKNSVPSSMLYTKLRNTTNKFLKLNFLHLQSSAIYTHLLLPSVSHHS